MMNFIKAFPPGPEDDVDYIPNVTHDTYDMFTSDAGVQRLLCVLVLSLVPPCASW